MMDLIALGLVLLLAVIAVVIPWIYFARDSKRNPDVAITRALDRSRPQGKPEVR